MDRSIGISGAEYVYVPLAANEYRVSRDRPVLGSRIRILDSHPRTGQENITYTPRQFHGSNRHIYNAYGDGDPYTRHSGSHNYVVCREVDPYAPRIIRSGNSVWRDCDPYIRLVDGGNYSVRRVTDPYGTHVSDKHIYTVRRSDNHRYGTKENDYSEACQARKGGKGYKTTTTTTLTLGKSKKRGDITIRIT